MGFGRWGLAILFFWPSLRSKMNEARPSSPSVSPPPRPSQARHYHHQFLLEGGWVVLPLLGSPPRNPTYAASDGQRSCPSVI
jgi:hypothetical protein